MDLDEYRQRSLAIWDRMASNWDSEREFLHQATGPVAEALVEGADLKPGQTVLELASGTGDVGFAAADRVGSEGRLISTDFSQSMVDAARGESERLGLGQVEHRRLDAEQMDLEDSSVDRVICRFGYMLMADPAAALAETKRVLRDDGRLAFAVWATPDRNMWAAIPGMTMVELGHLPPPEPGAPGIFAMGEQERVRELVTGAGFTDPQIEEVAVHWGYRTPEEHWEKTMALAGPISEVVEALPPEDKQKVEETVRSRVEGLLAQHPDGLDGMTLVAVATPA